MAEAKIDFGGVVDALPGLVWTTQSDGRSDFVNRAWREYTGLALDKAIDRGWPTAIQASVSLEKKAPDFSGAVEQDVRLLATELSCFLFLRYNSLLEVLTKAGVSLALLVDFVLEASAFSGENTTSVSASRSD
jgi:PAS domain-containing protein